MIQLSSVDEAVRYLDSLKVIGGEIDLDVKFAGELQFIRIDIEGPEFHHSITGELSRGLAAYQDEIYKAAKFALLGREGRVQLNADQRAAFELVFEVREGSTDLIASVDKIVDGLVAGLGTMDPVTLAVVIVSVVLILVGGHVAAKVHQGIQETKQRKDALDAETRRAEISVDLARKVASEQVALAKVLTEGRPLQVVERFESAQTEGVKQVVRSVPTATEVQFGGVPFDADDIKELRRRAPRSKSEYVEVVGNFKVFADTNITPIRLTLSGGELPGEFNVDFPADLDAHKLDWLWTGIKSKTVLPLEVGATIIREEVRGGVLLDVLGAVPLPRPDAATT